MPLDVVDEIREQIDDDPAIARDDSGERPETFEPETLYVWTESEARAIVECGPGYREDFTVIAVFVADNAGEEALQKRDAAVTEILDAKRDAYLAWIRDHEATPLWDDLAGVGDMDFIRNFEGRAVAVRASGYRFVG
jgi:hypothetical protein